MCKPPTQKFGIILVVINYTYTTAFIVFVNLGLGELLGMCLTNMMEDALKELATERLDPALLDQLRAFEVADRKKIMCRELPMNYLRYSTCRL
jgi:hypothetical protein